MAETSETSSRPPDHEVQFIDNSMCWKAPPLLLAETIREVAAPEFYNSKKRETRPYPCKYNTNASRTLESAYTKIKKIGKGTFGTVFMAKEINTQEVVAIKQIAFTNEKEGVPITALREILILFASPHVNIVQLKEIVTSDDESYKNGSGSIFLIFEYMDHDLTGLLDSHWERFTFPQIKSYAYQLVNGLAYCHDHRILHRDIKGSNVLVNKDGILKLADFGLARLQYPENDKRNSHFTNRVITLWYRPPELLLGSTEYTGAVDMWSVGCIIVELLRGKPLFQGTTEVDQIEKIFEVCGTPTEEEWPNVSSLAFFSLLKPKKVIKRSLRTKFTGRYVTDDAIDLVDKLLTLNPAKRLTAADALVHPYFTNSPLPEICSLLDIAPCHELQSKELRKKRQTRPDEPNFSPPSKIQKQVQGERVGVIQDVQEGAMNGFPGQVMPNTFYPPGADQNVYSHPQQVIPYPYDQYAYSQEYYNHQAPQAATETYYPAQPPVTSHYHSQRDYYRNSNYKYEADEYSRSSRGTNKTKEINGKPTEKHRHQGWHETERYNRDINVPKSNEYENPRRRGGRGRRN